MNKSINRRDFLGFIGGTVAGTALSGCTEEMFSSLAESGSSADDKPNFIVIFCDNLGYGDIGYFGSKKHRTPNIDRMAAEGMRFTSFYVTSGVCTPSRASLMTGCYPRRVNMHISSQGASVLRPVEPKGLHPNEITIAEVLKEQGYATACVGKWHLGDQPEFLPTNQGFDYYQMDQLQAVRSGKWKLHLPLKQKKNWGKPTADVPLQLYDLQADIGETNNVAAEYPEVVNRLLALAEKTRENLGDVNRKGRNQRPAGWVVTPKPLRKI